MAKGNYRSSPSWGCTWCGDRDAKLVPVGKGSNKLYLCDKCKSRHETMKKEVMK